jgi:hypothetical protein
VEGSVLGGTFLIAFLTALVLYLLLGRKGARDFFGTGCRRYPQATRSAIERLVRS